MPRHNSRGKKRTRARQEHDQIGYREARRREADEARDQVRDASLPQVSFAELAEDFRSVDSLLTERVEFWAASQVGEPADEGVWSELEPQEIFGVTIEESTVHQVVVNTATLVSHEVDTFQGGTVATTVFVEAELQIDGVVSKAEAVSLSETGLVTILDFHWSDHYAQVLVTATPTLELEFNAIVDPEFESIHDFEAQTCRVRHGSSW